MISPLSFASRAKESDLLDAPGWKSLNAVAKGKKKFERRAMRARVQSQKSATVFKFGARLPRSGAEALAFEAELRHLTLRQATEASSGRTPLRSSWINKK